MKTSYTHALAQCMRKSFFSSLLHFSLLSLQYVWVNVDVIGRFLCIYSERGGGGIHRCGNSENTKSQRKFKENANRVCTIRIIERYYMYILYIYEYAYRFVIYQVYLKGIHSVVRCMAECECVFEFRRITEKEREVVEKEEQIMKKY